ncbi:MAG: hypothetical protein A3H35_01190 [Betaproteobacteria bacterium RIFCSPLOWO2_02_FULL_62_17]|nr:MAG: hypothetical protein A3H35_01190 [Betaproteobacteria bacterium RIFCSPLOWO2_02_FULL_62_17]
MLREITAVAQNKPGFRRRWFEGKYFDLFTWQDAGGAYTSFQLCYDVEHRERAFSWRAGHGFFHDGVESSEDLTRGQPAILTHGGKLDAGAVLPRFQEESCQLPAEVRELIVGKIREHLLARRDVKSKRRKVRREDWQKRASGGAGQGESSRDNKPES